MQETKASPGPEQIYLGKLRSGSFQIQHCESCSHHVFYPRVLCPHCGAADLQWVDASGSGVIYSCTVVRRAPDAGGDYNVVLVDLAEGPRMMSRVDGVPASELRIGMGVRAQIVTENDQPIVVFVPAGGAA